MNTRHKFTPSRLLTFILALGLMGLLVIINQTVVAQSEVDATPLPLTAVSPMHPTFPLLDTTGTNVLTSGQPVSTMQTCGTCHDTPFIASHSFHADVGLSEMSTTETTDGRSWDISTGSFGKWNPITYRYLSAADDALIDLTTAEWVQLFGARHAGGGPSTTSRTGQPLLTLTPDAANVETSTHDPATGNLTTWNWQESGIVEMNCFLCHTPNPDNAARTAALNAGNFAWANAATLAQTGIITTTTTGWAWNPAAFDAQGQVKLPIQDPSNANCGQCHGVTHTDTLTPLTLDSYTLADFSTLTTGQIMSPQKIAQSGLNLSDKEDLSRSWDIHTERVLKCTNCHYSLNNPIYYQENAEKRPDYLLFDPRRIDIGEYLQRPLHQFAKGNNVQGSLATEFDNTLRRCESCHSIEATHNWLPYKDKHLNVVSCESCHIPKLYAPALEYIDWTVLQADGTPPVGYRGITGDEINATTLIEGYEPILLPRTDADGQQKLAPFNLITAWYWVYGNPARPVPQDILQQAFLSDSGYQPDILAAFDADGNGQLESGELVIDNTEKETAVTHRLTTLGLDTPHIVADVQPYSINHNVTNGDWINRDCRTCHSDDSRLAQAVTLSDRTPGGVTPTLLGNSSLTWAGQIQTNSDGHLLFQPQTAQAGLYILGHNAISLIDWLGALLFLGVMVGVATHGGMRYAAARKMSTHHSAAIREVYMYDVYERLWHWLQTVAILLLIFTGLVIHKPNTFGLFSFSYVVQVHNILAAILVINAALSLFYHLVSGEIQQYLPRPRGFFDQAIVQAKFYLGGIFRGDPHPFDKTRQHKLNPLQQMTYFGILNILLPLQIITGALMWGAQRWPTLAANLGGLPFMAPFHTLVAWMFASFVVMHVYLTTTGHTPLASIKAMMLGWDEVEVEHATGD